MDRLQSQAPSIIQFASGETGCLSQAGRWWIDWSPAAADSQTSPAHLDDMSPWALQGFWTITAFQFSSLTRGGFPRWKEMGREARLERPWCIRSHGPLISRASCDEWIKQENKNTPENFLLRSTCRDFPGGPIAKTLHSQCRGASLTSWLEN